MKRSLLVLLIVSLPLGAHAQSMDAVAKAHFERGQKLTEKSKYSEALAEFTAGYELSHRPLFLFNMGECARLAGDPLAARGYYERYLEEDPDGKLAGKAKERLARLPAPPPPAPAPAPAPEPLPAPVPAPAPPPPEDKPEPRAEHVELIPSPPPLHEERHSTPIYKSVPFWVGVGVVVVGGAVAAFALTRNDDAGCSGVSGVCLDFTKP